MILTISILLILLIVSVYINVNLTKKFEKMEEMAENSVDILLENEKFLTELKNRVLSQQSYLRQLDRIGSFESDDETGYFFKEMKDIINDIAIYFGQTPIDDNRESILEKQKFDAKFEKDYYL
jgi:competence protein ComGC